MSARSARALGVLAALALGAAAGACDKDASKTGGSDDTAVAAWRKAGLEVSALTDVDAKPYSAQGCKGGTVSGVDVILCRYDTGEDAKAAEDPALATLSGVTGAALANGSRLLVVADRRKADPTGRTIDIVTKTFRK